MKTKFLYLFIAVQLLIVPAIYSQQITGTLTYNYKDGSLTLDSKNSPIALTPKGTHSPKSKIFGLKQGQGVAIVVSNINPLKYYAQSSVSFSTITTAPPSPAAIDVDKMFTAVPEVKANATKTEPSAAPTKPKNNTFAHPFSPPQRIPPVAVIDQEKIKEMKNNIACIKGNIKAIETNQQSAKEIGKKFESFNNFYELMKTLDNLDKAGFDAQIQQQFVEPLKALTSSGYAKQLNTAADINAVNLNAIKKEILDKIDKATKDMQDCYDKLFESLQANPNEKKALQEELQKSSRNTETDLMLAQLPDTKKEYYKLQDWAKTTRQTINDTLWPAIDKTLTLFIFSQNLSFEVVAGTIMADEDIADITLIIKKVADNAEVKKIERIKFHTIGGFRMEYGVGLYVSGLSDDEFVLDRTSKIERVPVINGTTVDTVLQSVNYTTPRQSSTKNVNWGAMTFFQGRTNWGGWLNVGAYFGLGLLLNNNAKPIFSTGISLVFGTIPRGNLNIGTAWGKVNRLNPKYTLDKEFRGDITDPTVSQTKSRLLIGITWNLGKINAGSTTAATASVNK